MYGHLAVFDFDSTLTVKEVGDYDVADCIERVFGGEKRFQIIKQLFQELGVSNVTIVICSFNSHDVIQRALHESGLDCFVCKIWGWESFFHLPESKKSLVLEPFILEFNFSHVVFVDDSADNCRDIQNNLISTFTNVVFVSEKGGMNLVHCGRVMQWLETTKTDIAAAPLPSLLDIV